MSKYIGETPNLARLFAAQGSGAMLFFDEGDAFGKRTEVKDAHYRHPSVELGYLLGRRSSTTASWLPTSSAIPTVPDLSRIRQQDAQGYSLRNAPG